MSLVVTETIWLCVLFFLSPAGFRFSVSGWLVGLQDDWEA